MTGRITLVRRHGIKKTEDVLHDYPTKRFNYITSYGAGKSMDELKLVWNIVIPVELYMRYSYQKETLIKVVNFLINNGKIVYLEANSDLQFQFLRKLFTTERTLLLG